MYLRHSGCVSYRVIKFLKGLGITTSIQIPERRVASVKDHHSLRHSYCTLANKARIPVSVRMKLAGHKTVAMAEYYANHNDLDDLREAAQRLPTLNVRRRKSMVLFYSKLFMKAMKIGLKSKLRGKAVRLIDIYYLALDTISALLKNSPPQNITLADGVKSLQKHLPAAEEILQTMPVSGVNVENPLQAM